MIRFGVSICGEALLVHVAIDFQQATRWRKAEVGLQLWAAQIEIAILQAQVFGGQGLRRRSIQLKGKRARVIEDDKLARLDLNVAGSVLWIAGAFIAQHHFADHSQNIFAAHFFGFGVGVGGVLLVYHDLRDAVAVAQIDKGERTKVAPPRTPTHQRHSLADVFFAQTAA